MQVRPADHEVGRGLADFGAVEQEPEVSAPYLAPSPQVAAGGLETETVTAQAVLDALLDGMGGVRHMGSSAAQVRKV
jgi:hypothetical protein